MANFFISYSKFMENFDFGAEAIKNACSRVLKKVCWSNVVSFSGGGILILLIFIF